jgi:hypothetical protein
MPLRQPPAERSFSLIPPNWNPVSNDRVLPHLGLFEVRSQFSTYVPSLANIAVWDAESGIKRLVAREVLNTKTASTK